MTHGEALMAQERAEALRQRAEAVLSDPRLLGPCRDLWAQAHTEAVMALSQARRVLEGRTV